MCFLRSIDIAAPIVGKLPRPYNYRTVILEADKVNGKLLSWC